ncbi:MAG: transposase, partial [Muribaculaceae bacterium]|nr:transposase [Muribaculaceae bacterium]
VGEDIVFVTNNFDISAQQIADIYRNRWQIEIFFKWIKQNLTIKTLWGHSENAVKIHLWVAICAYLIVARIKADTKSSYTITEVATILGVSAFDKTSIRDLIAPEKPLIQNQNFKELNLFDDF